VLSFIALLSLQKLFFDSRMAALSLQTILAKNSSKCLVYRVVAK